MPKLLLTHNQWFRNVFTVTEYIFLDNRIFIQSAFLKAELIMSS